MRALFHVDKQRDKEAGIVSWNTLYLRDTRLWILRTRRRNFRPKKTNGVFASAPEILTHLYVSLREWNKLLANKIRQSLAINVQLAVASATNSYSKAISVIEIWQNVWVWLFKCDINYYFLLCNYPYECNGGYLTFWMRFATRCMSTYTWNA